MSNKQLRKDVQPEMRAAYPLEPITAHPELSGREARAFVCGMGAAIMVIGLLATVSVREAWRQADEAQAVAAVLAEFVEHATPPNVCKAVPLTFPVPYPQQRRGGVR